jgi:hypothetical protein
MGDIWRHYLCYRSLSVLESSGTLEADGNIHFVFIRYGVSAILIHHNSCQRILAHSGDPIWIPHISYFARKLLIGACRLQSQTTTWTVQMYRKCFRATTIQRIHVHLPLPSAITYLLHIAMADRKAMDLEGSLS